jgi:hypothetical protein
MAGVWIAALFLRYGGFLKITKTRFPALFSTFAHCNEKNEMYTLILFYPLLVTH